MGIITAIIVVVIILFLAPHIINWLRYSRCPKCGKWFCLEYHSFEVTDKVVGHHRTRTGGGSAFRLFGISLVHRSRTRDDPFIREWGEARYICRACGRHVSFYNVIRDR